jgi:hypothetical protein
MKRVWGRVVLTSAVIAVLAAVAAPASVRAAAPPPENPKQGSVGLQGTVPTTPPSRAATIATPTNGQSFTRTPISVNGLCQTGLLVKVFSNNVFVGSVMCVNGSYSLQIDLFDGRNDIVARVFDALDQPGPDSNIVSVTFVNNQFRETGVPLLSLTSTYARRGANPGELLTWPIIMSGGTGPYAVSVSWGDNKPPSLISQPFAGTFSISHIYDSAGVYNIVVKATDKNGVSAYLQLVGEANGAVTQSSAGGTGDSAAGTIVKVMWLPAAICIPLIMIAFWLGRRYELTVLRKHLENLE